MSGNISFKSIASLSIIIISLLVFSSIAFSDHTQATTLDISGIPVANWTESNTTNLYNFSIQANESINITTINIPATFSLNDSTINSSGYHSWNCTNTSATTVKCNTSQNTTTSINIWFNA
ncbi:MAG: hypothetical protein KAJ20_04585, partial [Candidatus Aenigmarchaeota archaeon]|nr:hypothetical protein [Candidatus Aenigmarchaeota archaeon]